MGNESGRYTLSCGKVVTPDSSIPKMDPPLPLKGRKVTDAELAAANTFKVLPPETIAAFHRALEECAAELKKDWDWEGHHD